MADIKQASFMMLILLVSISGVYEWAQTEPVFKDHLSFEQPSGFESDSLESEVGDITIAGEDLIETSERTDLLSYIGSLLTTFASSFGIVMKLLFGWSLLLNAIFTSIGLDFVSVIFIPPIAIIQLLGIFYFIRDIVNTIRGVN